MTAISIAIVGASLAGARAAQSLRKQGFDGSIRVIGSEHHPPYDRPPLSKDVLIGKSTLRDTYLESEGTWTELEIDLVLGQPVVALRTREREVELADGSRIRADKVLLATGARARHLNVAGSDLAGVFCLRTMDDSLAIRDHLANQERVVVVGAGFIGAEVAASARALGCETTLVEIAPVPLWRVLGADMGRFYAQVHRDHGVKLLTGVGIESIVGDQSVRQVVLTDGSTLEADLVVVGVGVEPVSELAEQIGADVGDGIVVNEYCETTIPDVYAAGDVANHPNAIVGEQIRLEHWQNAQNQAVAAAASMLGRRNPFCEVPWFWSDQYDLNLQMAGHPRGSDDVVWRGSSATSSFSAFYLRDGRLRAVLGVNRPHDVRAGSLLIAASASVAPEILSDESIDLRALARAARDAGSVEHRSPVEEGL